MNWQNLHPLNQSSNPSYLELTRFLIAPFVNEQAELRLDCETFSNGSRIWLRLAIEGDDCGRVYGKFGKNIQAIRTIMEMVASSAGQSLYLEVYDPPEEQEADGEKSAYRPRNNRNKPSSKNSRRRPPA